MYHIRDQPGVSERASHRDRYTQERIVKYDFDDRRRRRRYPDGHQQLSEKAGNQTVIAISRASLYIPHEGIITETTKNDSSTRFIKAPVIAMQTLKEYRRWQAQKRLSMGDRWVDCDRLFTRDNGQPIHPDTISGWFADFIKRHKLPHVTIHSLRHTNATLMINSGIPLTTIASRLGHADPTTTSKIYVQAIKSADAAAAEQLDLIFTKRQAATG